MVIDEMSLDLVKGSKIDYVEEMISSSFQATSLGHRAQGLMMSSVFDVFGVSRLGAQGLGFRV